MSGRGGSSTRPAALKADIRVVEDRIRHHHDNIGMVFRSMAHNIRERLISPSTLFAAGVFGAALHRSRRLQALRLLAILQAVNTGLRRLLPATSRTSVKLD